MARTAVRRAATGEAVLSAAVIGVTFILSLPFGDGRRRDRRVAAAPSPSATLPAQVAVLQ